MTTHLLPYRVENIGKTRIVHFLDPAALDLSVGFFRDTLNLAETPVSRHIAPVPTYLQSPAPSGDIPPPIIIFHIARCGSTLLCQNLKATGQFVVLGEPGFINKTIADTTMPLAEKAALVRCMIRQWMNWAHLQGKRLVIKLSSSINGQVADAIDILGPATLIGLYRAPGPVLESLVRKPPGHLEREHQWQAELSKSTLAARMEAVPDTAIITGDVKRKAGYLAISLEAMQHVKKAGGHMLDYRELALSFDTLVKMLTPTVENKSCNIAWNDKWAAKSRVPKKKSYEPVAPALLSRFADEHEPVLDVLTPAYEKLRA